MWPSSAKHVVLVGAEQAMGREEGSFPVRTCGDVEFVVWAAPRITGGRHVDTYRLFIVSNGSLTSDVPGALDAKYLCRLTVPRNTARDDVESLIWQVLRAADRRPQWLSPIVCLHQEYAAHGGEPVRTGQTVFAHTSGYDCL